MMAGVRNGGTFSKKMVRLSSGPPPPSLPGGGSWGGGAAGGGGGTLTGEARLPRRVECICPPPGATGRGGGPP